MIHATTRRSVLGFIFISAMVLVLAGPVPRADAAQVRCCQGSVCAMRSAKKCAAQGGVNIGPGKCAANSCAGATTTTTTTVPTTTTTVTTTTTTVPTTTHVQTFVPCVDRFNRFDRFGRDRCFVVRRARFGG